MLDFEREKRAYEADISQVAGRRLGRVHYFEIRYEVGFFGWSSVPGVGHSVGSGLDLEMTDGAVFGLTWGSSFWHHDVRLVRGSLRGHRDPLTEVDVSDTPDWRPYIGQPVTSTQVFWSWVAVPDGQRLSYPQDVALHFAAAPPVYVSVSEYVADQDKLFPMADELLVIFSPEAARKYGIGPYAPDQRAL